MGADKIKLATEDGSTVNKLHPIPSVLYGKAAKRVTTAQSANGYYVRLVETTGTTQLTSIADNKKVRLHYMGLSNYSTTTSYYIYCYFDVSTNKIWFNRLAKNGGGFNANFVDIPLEGEAGEDLYLYAQSSYVKTVMIFEILDA